MKSGSDNKLESSGPTHQLDDAHRLSENVVFSDLERRHLTFGIDLCSGRGRFSSTFLLKSLTRDRTDIPVRGTRQASCQNQPRSPRTSHTRTPLLKQYVRAGHRGRPWWVVTILHQ
jgi:hypothetical protein